ncbi:MAG: glycoside hydrolase family 27 protein, partial [Terracidiphilus sp.]
MTFERHAKNAMNVSRALPILGLMLCVLAASGFSRAQSLTGRWGATGKMLDNGEQQKAILDLKQDGNRLTGTVIGLGFSTAVKGTVNGSHFELFGVDWNDKNPFLVGNLVNGKIEGTQWGDKFQASPATPADEFPKLLYLDPPALHKVPNNGLAKTPPMGWNSWNLFAERIDDETVRAMADAMVSSGMRDAGYIYVNIDDTWEGTRDAQGVIQTNNKFPDMKALADYVHSKGLKLGIYSGPGPKTCAGFEASYQHEEQDAKSYAGWGIDYLKYDLCSFRMIMRQQAPHDQQKQNEMMHAAYEKMHKALQATGRPIVYSLCQYGWDDVWKWGP